MLGGRYRLTRQIAVGGMGEVWVAHDTALARDIAIKVLRDEFAGDPGFLERFRTEARNAASLSHPGIAALFDYGEQDGSAFLVMELVVGEPMSDLLEREPILPTDRLLPILAQTARALHAAHEAGVVHRDVKPGNILLTPAGRVKITDFGVSLANNQVPMTATGMVMGTAQYLSPEQAIGGPATSGSDLYSLGIIAYESLVGHRPFTGPTAVDIAVAHVNVAVPPLPATVPVEIARLVMRLLAKDPAERPSSAAELAAMFDSLAARTPPEGVPAPAAQVSVAVGAPAVAPPSFPPRRALRGTPPGGSTRQRPAHGERGAHAGVAGRGPAAAHARSATRPGSSGQLAASAPHPARAVRSGFRLRWPLVALLLLVLAVLGATLADRVLSEGTGAVALLAASSAKTGDDAAATRGTDADAPGGPTADIYAPAGARDGMIPKNAPTLDAAGTRTTTAKDA